MLSLFCDFQSNVEHFFDTPCILLSSYSVHGKSYVKFFVTGKLLLRSFTEGSQKLLLLILFLKSYFERVVRKNTVSSSFAITM